MMRTATRIQEWRGDLTLFGSFFNTFPAHEEIGASARRVADLIAPAEGPMVVAEKKRALYFVPSRLKEAPLIGETLEKAKELGRAIVGKMRSGSHVIAGALSKLDGDGVTAEQFAEMKARLEREGIAYLIYSTHSHGRTDKPGIRCRIVVFLDRALPPEEYKRAMLALSAWLFGKSFDPTDAQLSQQAGVWIAHPDRLAQTFCFRQLDGHCASVDALLQAVPKVNVKLTDASVPRVVGPLPLDAVRIGEALNWLDAAEYKPWVDAAIWLRAAYGDEAFPIWLAWSQTAADEHRATEEECERLWAGVSPRITAVQGSGALFAHARDGAVGVARNASETGQWDQKARDALVYLRVHHRRAWGAMFGVAA